MGTKEAIIKHKQNGYRSPSFTVTTKIYSLVGEPMVECRDAILNGGKYVGIAVSDILIFDPKYIGFIIKSKRVSPDLVAITKEIKSNQILNDIDVDIALS